MNKNVLFAFLAGPKAVTVLAQLAECERAHPKLTNEWGSAETCDNCGTMKRTTFKDDNECDCGVKRHHYHCPDCGRLQQIG